MTPRPTTRSSDQPGRGLPLGRRGELAAAAWLRRRGYRIDSVGLRTRHGEIDLLARRRRLWVAVEVKTRRRDPAPEAAVDQARLQRLAGALEHLGPHLRPRPKQLRVDVIAVVWPHGAAPEIRHFPGTAWWV